MKTFLFNAMLVCTMGCLADTWAYYADEAFLATIDTTSSEGYIIVEKVGGPDITEASPRIATIISWKDGSIISEAHLMTNNALATNVLFSGGTWAGTNWEYRAGTLIEHGKPGPVLAQAQAMMGGRTSDKLLLDQILGRGFDLQQFHTLKLIDGVLTGRFDDRLSLTGWVANAGAPLKYTWGYRVQDAPFAMLSDVQLVPFGLKFIPTHVRLSIVSHETTNCIFAYRAVSYGTNAYFKSLSPRALYMEARTLKSENDHVFDPATPHRKSTSARTLFLTFCGMSVIVLIALALKKRGKIKT